MTTKSVHISQLDRVDMLSSKLESLLVMTCGDGFEAFNAMSDEMKDSYLWACADMASELKRACSELGKPIPEDV